MTGLARSDRGATRALDKRQRRQDLIADLAQELEINPQELAVRREPAPVVSEAIPQWLATLAVGKSPRTALNYRTAAHRFTEFLLLEQLDPGSTSTSALPPDIVEKFVVALHAAYGGKRATVHNYTCGIRSFCRWLFRRGWGMDGSTYELVDLGLREILGKFVYRHRRPDPQLPVLLKQVVLMPVKQAPGPDRRGGLTPDEARLIGLRDRAAMLLMLTSGLRVSEVVSLDRSVLAEDIPVVVGKGNKERPIFLSDPARQAIEEYLQARGDAFPSLFCSHHRSSRVRAEGKDQRGRPRAGRRLTSQSLGYIVGKYAKRAGIVVTPHAFRHRFAQDLLAAGAAMSEVSEILGHSSVATTHAIYARHSADHLKAAYAKYSSKLAKLLPPIE